MKKQIMKKILTSASLIALNSILVAQNTAWPGPSAVANVGIGTTSPTQKLDVRGVIHTVNNGYTYVGRDFAPGNDSYFYHKITTNYQILGSSSNGTGSVKKMGFAMGGLDTEADVKMTIDPNGHTGIGTTAQGATQLMVKHTGGDLYATGGSFFADNATTTNVGLRSEASNASSNTAGQFVTSGGSSGNIGVFISNNASGTPANDWGLYCIGRTWCTLGLWSGSDRKIKDNIKPLNNMLDKIKLLKPSTYTFKTTEFKDLNLPDGEQIGLIAQELEQIFPGMVSDSKGRTQTNEKGDVTINTPDLKSVNYINLIPVLISGIQEQQALIENLTNTNNAQQKQLNEQKEMITALVNKAGNTTGVGEINSIPAGYELSENIPNPFNNETTINYTLPKTVVNASLIIYDLSGKQITSFPLTEKGTASIAITSEKLAAGIYIYSVMADGKIVDSKRMIVSQK